MNERQKNVLEYLLSNNNDFLTIQDIAQEIDCSEKTIRNDFKKIDEWLNKETNAKFIRTPSIGVKLEIEDLERRHLLNTLNKTEEINLYKSEEVRLSELTKILLYENKIYTIQELADKFYLNKMIMKKDLEKVKKWLEKFDLTLTSKQKIGVKVEGDERKKRSAMSQLTDILKEQNYKQNGFVKARFQAFEIEKVRVTLKDIQEELKFPFTEETFNNLITHILIGIKRIKLKNQIRMTEHEISNIKSKKGFDIAKKITDKLENFFVIKFPEDEIAYIALHIIGGKYQTFGRDDLEIINDLEVEEIVLNFSQKMIEVISDITKIDFSADEQLFSGLTIHIHSTFYRLKHGLTVSNPMFEEIKKMYPYMFEVVLSTLSELREELTFDVSNDEIAYITLHFQASMERLKRINGDNKKALIVCSMGIGMSRLLQTKLERKFHSLDVVDCISLNEIEKFDKEKIDFIITTVPLNDIEVPVIEVTPLLPEIEQERLKTFIKEFEVHKNPNSNSKFPTIKKFLQQDSIELQLNKCHRFEVIEVLSNNLHKNGFVGKHFGESAIIREKTSSTVIGGGVAIPHGKPDYIKKPTLTVATLERPIEWQEEKVSLVFLLATKIDDVEITKTLFQEISNLSEQPDLIQKLIKQKKTKDFIELL